MIKPLLHGLDTLSRLPRTVVSDVDTMLRPFHDDDCSALADAFDDTDIRRWNPGPAVEEGEIAIRAWMDGRNDWSDGSHASWAISDASGALLGSVSLHKIDLEQADAEVGYWVAPWARGRGRGAAAVTAAARFGFEELHLHRLHLFHAVENVGSCRVAAAADFQIEGRLRLSYRFGDG